MVRQEQNRIQAISRLSTTIPQLFNEAQKPNAVLMRLSVSLRKVQETCVLKSPIVEGQPQDIDQDGEAAFNKEYIRNLNKILPIRRKEPHADNIVRYVATFLQYTQKQDNDGQEDDSEDETQDDVQETISSRFARILMVHILKGLNAKSLNVRLRCCQIIALSVSCLGEIDEDLYQLLKTALYERIKDKEGPVRVQAVTALSRLQSADDEPDANDGLTIIQKLIWILRHDPSAEVRRVVIVNLELNSQTLPYIIERARDVDSLNRRIVFQRRLSNIPDFRMISSEDRLKVIKWGLSDRDSSVKLVVGKMIADFWIKHADHNLLEFLERMDVMEGAENGVSEKMLTTLLELRMPSMNLTFDDQFWDNLSPESAFLARVLTNFLHSKKMEDELDKVLPEVTRHAFYIQHYNNLWQQASKETEGEYEFIVGQLLGLATRLDYADEVGRRKMYSILREIILVPDLPDEHLAALVDLLSMTATDECDFTRIIVEVIGDIQEQADIDEEETQNNIKRLKLSEEAMMKTEYTEEADPRMLQIMLAKLKCLSICKFMLERCQESLQDNSSIYGLLNQLVIPAVQNKEIVLREEGLHCLGLVCHLDKTLAMHNIPLFVHCIQNGNDELKKKALKILFDMIMKYGYNMISEKMENPPELFEYCLDHDSPEIQAIACEGLAKLILSRSYKHEETLKLLVILYFFPTSIDNNKVQQCLSYFFPAYCHSSTENQQCMSNIGVAALVELTETFVDLKEGEHMVEPTVIAEMLTHWTDPRQLSVHRRSDDEVDIAVQGKMAIEILLKLTQCPSDEDVLRKTMCHAFLRLYLDDIDQKTITRLLALAEVIEKERPIIESLYRTHFNKAIRRIQTLHRPTVDELSQEHINEETTIQSSSSSSLSPRPPQSIESITSRRTKNSKHMDDDSADDMGFDSDSSSS
ncbi:nuclear condensing complex subunit [Halteromyces radiatus]|uniref:nuclear condensing complex subunit n=1 Tax=Halteromyces radiatus TaxID=101107 RepID=UPI00221FCC8C|nr:nuclear condensing complex subunit [Halteromyces radiatus]KAI8100193.1 nuclear condensing complex subunit [Halteromyces radiatus]